MKKYRYGITALLLAVAVLAAALTACTRPAAELTEEQKADVQKKLAAYMSQDGLSAAAYVVYRGEVLYAGGSGSANADQSNSPDMVYGIASLTKQFTAASILQLYDAGKLDLNDRLSVYYPDYAYADQITLRQLLSMRSGIPDYSIEEDGGYVRVQCTGDSGKGAVISADNPAVVNREIIRRCFLSQELLFTPGSRYHYSDANFFLLAEIIEQVSGVSYHTYVRDNIFTPLEMDRASFIDEAYEDDVYVAQTDTSEFSQSYYDYKGVEFGCGDILASAKDLYKWYKGLTSGAVVSDRAYRLMTKNYSGNGERGYGFGLMISDDSDSKVVFHYGYIPTYYSSLIFIPACDYFEVVLSNRAMGRPQKTAADMAVYVGDMIGLTVKNIY